MDRLTFKLGKSNPTYGLINKAASKSGLFTDYDGFFANLQATHKLGKYEDTDLTPVEIMALKAEKQKRDEGCEFCCFTEHQDATLYPRDNAIFYAGYSEQFDVDKFDELEIDKIHFCPQCGRKL